jgi:hypothetical protein
MWKIPVPSRLHVFLWLLANNKVLTRDNLAKRRAVNDKTCLFVVNMNQYEIYFLIVVWLTACGML